MFSTPRVKRVTIKWILIPRGQAGWFKPWPAEEEEKAEAAHEVAVMAALPMPTDIDRLNKTIICYAETIYRFNGLWEGPDPLTPLISLFLIQLTVSMIIIHLLVYALKPFHQPPFVAEILGGMLLGPSAFGRIKAYRRMMFPNYSFRILEPMSHLFIGYYAFLAGLKMDVRAITRTGPKALKIAITGTIIPFLFGSAVFFIFTNDKSQNFGFLFWGAALTVTGFSVLSKVLETQQILHTEIGKTAQASALISDMCSWIFLAVAFAVTSSPSNSPWSLISIVAFLLLCVFYIRPVLSWIIQKTPEGQGYSEFYICSILTGMALSGVITDTCGTHPMIGAFIFGLVIPSEVLEATIVEKLDDFVMGILMPVYFVVCGLRTNIDAISDTSSWFVVGFVIVLACTVKALSSLILTIFSDLPVNEAMAVGLLSNAKGTLVLVILEAGQIQGALRTETYSMMMVAVLLMTMIVTPAAIWFRPVQSTVPYKRRTLQKAKSDEELRIVACIYNIRNVPTIINLLRTSNASTKSPISVVALQLVELVGRASTMMVVHNSHSAGPRNPSHIEAQADQITAAFDNYELRSEGVQTQAVTARCAYATMDEDICTFAKDKRPALVIIPFHKQQTLDGEMEDINPSIRSVNEGILANAPCSVGILIDRGLVESHDHASNIAVLFFGGPDDREALAYAWRMAGNTDVRLTVVRFIPSTDAEKMDLVESIDQDHLSLPIDLESEKLLDDDYLGNFKTAIMKDKSITYCELVLNDEEEAIKAIKLMDENKHDLYLVGRGRGMISPLTSGLADWCDCPELGPIGDLLVTSEFESSFSVLVVQQYINTDNDGSIRSANSGDYGEEVLMRPSVSESVGFESLDSFRRWEQGN
ncbi:UNVERIFIED_CONTAM: Cation/H(+) antiporter 15 [Sesamum latifolium]|uniref:Cation/H(+) antiporter 15 n=1 Tax=Sesamum latifolium TaxID=2727402 RepID=A0AAW2WN24_9LAMI